MSKVSSLVNAPRSKEEFECLIEDIDDDSSYPDPSPFAVLQDSKGQFYLEQLTITPITAREVLEWYCAKGRSSGFHGDIESVIQQAMKESATLRKRLEHTVTMATKLAVS